MISVNLLSTKNIMGALLIQEHFDDFYVEDVTISTFNTFTLDGHINKDFYTTEEISNMENGLPVFSSWKDIRPICFQLIKGKKTPVSFKFVLHANEDLISKICEQPEVTIQKNLVKGLILNIRYEEGKVTIITACSYNTFVMDKSLDPAWDKYLPKLLTSLNLDFEETN